MTTKIYLVFNYVSSKIDKNIPSFLQIWSNIKLKKNISSNIIFPIIL
jgi:hypothetical protein